MKKIEIENIRELKRGDIIQHKKTGNSYVIEKIYDKFAVAIRAITILNECEWWLMKRDLTND